MSIIWSYVLSENEGYCFNSEPMGFSEHGGECPVRSLDTQSFGQLNTCMSLYLFSTLHFLFIFLIT